jgi:DNA/RNA-binding protein KIN17
MPKHGALTPKAIGNRIKVREASRNLDLIHLYSQLTSPLCLHVCFLLPKAKGLQKLRWYCQMCAKQCRDENGFKCHITSESHLRQMRVFQEDPDSVMEEYSKEFEEDFMELLSRRFGTKRTHANHAYNEFIAHKSHTHMNATKWETLTNFVKYLGKTGKCLADETEKGWYIQWIDRDPALLARQEAADRKRKSDLDDDERQQRVLQAQVQAAHALAAASGDSAAAAAAIPSELVRDAGAAGISLAVPLSSRGGGSGSAKRARTSALSAAFSDDDSDEPFGKKAAPAAAAAAPKKSALEALMEQDSKRQAAAAAAAAATKQADADNNSSSSKQQQSSERLPNWLHTGIVVKVMNKKVGDGKYYKQKAAVRRVIEDYVAEVKMLDSSDKLRVDQDQLETVIPAVGKAVLIVNGACRGCEAVLQQLNVDDYCATVKVLTGKRRGDVLSKVDYEDICKLADA